MPQDFVPLAERIVDALLDADPGLARWAGDHRHDDRLPDFSPDAVMAETAMLRDAALALSEVEEIDLDAEENVDHAALLALVERRLFELTDVREHEWNPMRHNPGPLLHPLIARSYAPVADRLESLAGRLRAIPDSLAVARTVLRGCPRIHLETSVGQFAGTAALIRGEVPAMLAAAPQLAGRVTPAAEAASGALDEFVGWLRDRLAEPGEARDARLGRRLWEARLWHALDTHLSAAQVLAGAEANLETITGELREAAAELVGGPATDDTVREALRLLGEERPDNRSIVELARHSLEDCTEFVRQHGFVSLIDDPCLVQEMPEFARGVAIGYCDPPGPLETADVPTFYCIAPTPSDWSAERVTSFYREYNDHMVRNLTVHEAMPGHFLQRAHARRFVGSSRARALCSSGSFTEGWAVYAEELMVRHGFGGPPVRIQQLKMQLRMTLNAILDQLVHCENLAEPEAMRLMMDRAFQEDGEAAGKWRRALLTSAQLSTYFVGYTEVAAIAADRPTGMAERDWHDEMLAHGSPAPRHLRSLIVEDDRLA